MELTALCLRYNAANYTIWWYRRQCISTLSNQEEEQRQSQKQRDEHDLKFTYYGSNRIKADLELASDLGGSNPKNYQVWYHRRSLLEYDFETFNSEACSSNDGNDNKTMQVVKEELEYIANVLGIDAKNYHVR